MRTLALLAAATVVCTAQTPTPDVLKQVLTTTLLGLRPEGFTERQVLFQSVTAGTKKGAFYPFTVNAIIRDYGPGYPPNRYYGQTCIRKMDGWNFNLSPGANGQWAVDGMMTVTNASVCRDNPGAGVSAVPLATLPGTPAPAGAPAAELHVGEWACYGTGGRLMTGMGFRLQPNGGYVDLDNRRAGRYSYNKAAATITFQGGFLDGQSGKSSKPNSFQISNTVSCEPWR
jgi:hypothetical protein